MECTEYVAGKIGWHHYHDAYTWWHDSQPPGYHKQRENGCSHAPKTHDILVYDKTLPGSNGHGHVAWVDKVDEKKRQVHISEANFSHTGKTDTRVLNYSITHGKYNMSANHLYGWLSK